MSTNLMNYSEIIINNEAYPVKSVEFDPGQVKVEVINATNGNCFTKKNYDDYKSVVTLKMLAQKYPVTELRKLQNSSEACTVLLREAQTGEIINCSGMVVTSVGKIITGEDTIEVVIEGPAVKL